MEEVFRVIVGVMIGLLVGGIVLGLFAAIKVSSWCSMQEEYYRIKKTGLLDDKKEKKGKKCQKKS